MIDATSKQGWFNEARRLQGVAMHLSALVRAYRLRCGDQFFTDRELINAPDFILTGDENGVKVTSVPEVSSDEISK
jgi:hypothetical protein